MVKLERFSEFCEKKSDFDVRLQKCIELLEIYENDFIHEDINFGDGEILDKILLYLEDSLSKGKDQMIQLVKELFSYFKQNKKIIIFIVGVLIASFSFSELDITRLLKDSNVDSPTEIIIQSKKETESSKKHDLKKFLNDLSERESSSDPHKINTYGYLGKYQFGKSAIKDILEKNPNESESEYMKRINSFYPKNFKIIETDDDWEEFQSNFKNKGIKFWKESKQDKAMIELLKKNLAHLGGYADKWDGKVKKGIKISKAGLLAGSHLMGSSNVKKFLDDGIVTRDAYGTPITEYMKNFSNYRIEI